MKNNLPSRTITGIVIFFLSAFFIFFVGLKNGDYFAVLFGFSFMIIALFIFFNKKEDEIEEIKNE